LSLGDKELKTVTGISVGEAEGVEEELVIPNNVS